MSVFECERMAQEYGNWLREGVNATAVGDVCVMTSPFVDRHRDLLQVYVTRTESGLLISDDGYVIRDLKISGLELDTERRREALHQILKSFGIKLDGDELQVVATDEDFAPKKHDMIQAMLAIGDLIHLAGPTVAVLFKEDVERYLRTQQIQYVVDVKLAGTSGLDHSFDFVIGASDSRPERYIRAIGTPGRDNIVEMLSAWQDLKDARPSNALAYAILNDQGNRTISRTHLAALAKTGITTIPWSDREKKVVELLS